MIWKKSAKHKGKNPNQSATIQYASILFQASHTLKENRYFNLHAKTYRGLIAKLREEYSHYAEGPGYKIYAPWTWSKSTNGNPTHAVFEAAYTFGPKVQYHIYIKEIYSEDLTD